MAGRRFEAGIRQDARPVIIDLHGEIDAQARDRMNAVYLEGLQASQGPIILNFSDIDYINSSGIAVIVGILRQSRLHQREMRGFGLTEHFRELFEITRLADFLRLFPDEESAIEAVPAPVAG